MKNLIMILMLTFRITTVAQEKKNKNAKYDIEVNGNCDQCKKRIEKAAFSVSGVKSASWDVESHNLHIVLNEEKATILQVQKAIAKAGHDTKQLKATDEDYNNLHHCCLYKRE